MKRPTISIQKAKKEISLVQYLANHSHYPVGKSGKRLQYKSPFRAEKKPSMFVDEAAGLWNDFGHGGGSIIDLVLHIHHEIQTVQEALEHLAQYAGMSKAKPPFLSKTLQLETENANSPITNLQIHPLNHYVLLKYLREERAISKQIAQKYLHLVFYDNKNRQGLFGLGWKNDSGYWEIRSAGNTDFKAVTGSKDITTITTNGSFTKKLYLFEGMLDFLSALMLKNATSLEGQVIVLNSTSMIKKIVPIIEKGDFETIYSFFDNDKGGVAAFKKLKTALPRIDIRPQTFYQAFNDVNDYWVDTMKNKNK